MSNNIRRDALAIRKLVREAEAVTDEAMLVCARLKQAMVTARKNPEVEVHTGQRALLRLNQAESQALALSTSLLRVHHELSELARETMGPDGDVDTVIVPSAIAEQPAFAPA